MHKEPGFPVRGLILHNVINEDVEEVFSIEWAISGFWMKLNTIRKRSSKHETKGQEWIENEKKANK